MVRAVLQVDVTVTKATTVTQEVVVNAAIVTVFDAAQLAIALTRTGVTAHAALLTDAGRELHIPFTVIAFRVGFIGKYAGWADFNQVAGKLAFQRAVFRAAEVNVVMRAINAQIGTVSIIFVIPHTAVAGDTAVHLMRNERAKVLITVGAFGEAIAAEAVAGHYRHILQMTVTALFAYRTVVRVVGH